MALGDNPADNLGKDRQPALLLLTADEQLQQLVAETAAEAWRIEHLRDPGKIGEVVLRTNPKVVLVDDEAVADHERGWLLTQLRRHLPAATVVYVAGKHDESVEKQARGGGAHYYTAKPIHPEQFAGILKSFLRYHQ